MRTALESWQFWALLSALFAALTAIFGKVGVERIDSNFATLIRCLVIVAFIGIVVAASGAAQPLAAISGKTYLFLTLSGLATGVSWLCYYRALQLGPAAQVAPLDKLHAWSHRLLRRKHKHAYPNGIIALKGGDLRQEIAGLPGNGAAYTEVFPIQSFFKEPYFLEKWVVYVQG